MKTLLLLRHGKSSWDDRDLPDHERPLAPRGIKAAGKVGRWLRRESLTPGLVLCSTARRTCETLEWLCEQLPGGRQIPVERERGLYLCGARVLLERLRDLPEEADRVLLLAHNPDLHDLALVLTEGQAASSNPGALATLNRKYPTAACAWLELPIADWRSLTVGSARLLDFFLPRKG